MTDVLDLVTSADPMRATDPLPIELASADELRHLVEGRIRSTEGSGLPGARGARPFLVVGMVSALVVAAIGIVAVLARIGAPAPVDNDPVAPPTIPAVPNRMAEVFDLADWITVDFNNGAGTSTYLMHPDGTELTRLKLPAEYARTPDWSPDGTKIVVSGKEVGYDELFEYDLGRIPEHRFGRLLFACNRPCFGDFEPAYSPDGRRIAFVRVKAEQNFQSATGGSWGDFRCGIWIGTIASGNVEQITGGDPAFNGGVPRPCPTTSPRWSPDGDKLVFSKQESPGSRNTDEAVFVIDVTSRATSREVSQITDFDLEGTSPDWSPDGDWIVFGTNALLGSNGTGRDLYRVRPDGSDLQQLTFLEPPQGASDPRYTADGDWIVFTVSGEVWVMPSGGGEAIPLPAGGGFQNPDWQPTTMRLSTTREETDPGGLTVESSIAPNALIDEPIPWIATVSGDVEASQVDRVEFLIDHHLTYVDRHAPYWFNDDHRFFVPSVMDPGTHLLTINVWTTTGALAASAENTVTTTRPPVPGELAGQVFERHSRIGLGYWYLRLETDGVMRIVSPAGERLTEAFAASEDGTFTLYGPANSVIGTEHRSQWCAFETSPIGVMTWTRGTTQLVLTPTEVPDPCPERASRYSGEWRPSVASSLSPGEVALVWGW